MHSLNFLSVYRAKFPTKKKFLMVAGDLTACKYLGVLQLVVTFTRCVTVALQKFRKVAAQIIAPSSVFHRRLRLVKVNFFFYKRCLFLKRKEEFSELGFTKECLLVRVSSKWIRIFHAKSGRFHTYH